VSDGEPLLRVENLEKYYKSDSDFIDRILGRQRDVEAVDGVSFEIREGETLGLVGESGCGKSTIGRSVLQLREPTAGSVYFKGRDITELSANELRDLRKEMQIIFQNPQSSLNPRLTVNDIIGEALDIHGIEDDSVSRDRRIKELLERVGLNASHASRYPHEFSGGQLQRIGIARALAVDPDFIVCDEPVSALDVSVQAQILNLLEDLQDEFGIAYLFIAHDLSVVEHIADEIAVMYLGKIAEVGTPEELFTAPQHPYTEALLSAIPEPDPLWEGDRILLEGSVPSPIGPPSGCRFHTRCPRVIPPADYEFGQDEWRAVLSLRHQVSDRDLAVESLAESADGPVTDAIRAETGIPETVSDPEAERVVSEAVESLAAGEFEAAETLLNDAFETPCATDEPALRDVDAGRIACHLFDPAYEAEPGGGRADRDAGDSGVPVDD
jgi:peptide/nickel transport system ATP-binding protein